jgi:hypothetical protein
MEADALPSYTCSTCETLVARAARRRANELVRRTIELFLVKVRQLPARERAAFRGLEVLEGGREP